MLAPSVTRRLIEAFARRPAETSPSPSRLASLTAREREVLLLLARGYSNSEIAAALFVCEATVKTHVGNLLAKLGLRDRVQAVILAYETGMVMPGDPDPATPPPATPPRLPVSTPPRCLRATPPVRIAPESSSAPAASAEVARRHDLGSFGAMIVGH